MRFLIHQLLFFGIALGVGFGLSYLALEKGQLFSTLRVGPWVAWSEVGSPQPDPYTRAHISRDAALELARAEGIRFVATQDSAGQNLLAQCTYRVDGTTPESSLWTLVAIAQDGSFATKPNAPLALRSDHLIYEGDGSFEIHIGPDLSHKNWLETSSTGALKLALTLYDSSVFSGFTSAANSLPSIFLEGCR